MRHPSIRWVVDSASVTILTRGFLRVSQCLFLSVQLLLQALRFLLLFQLILVVLHAVVVAIGFDEVYRVVQLVDVTVRRFLPF